MNALWWSVLSTHQEIPLWSRLHRMRSPEATQKESNFSFGRVDFRTQSQNLTNSSRCLTASDSRLVYRGLFRYISTRSFLSVPVGAISLAARFKFAAVVHFWLAASLTAAIQMQLFDSDWLRVCAKRESWSIQLVKREIHTVGKIRVESADVVCVLYMVIIYSWIKVLHTEEYSIRVWCICTEISLFMVHSEPFYVRKHWDWTGVGRRDPFRMDSGREWVYSGWKYAGGGGVRHVHKSFLTPPDYVSSTSPLY